MFSSGSDRSVSPRHDRGELVRGLSMVASSLGDDAESGAVGPLMSPVLQHPPIMSTTSGLGSPPGLGGSLGPATPSASSALGQNGMPAAGFSMLEPPKSIPDTEARRSKARMYSRVHVAAPDSSSSSPDHGESGGGGSDSHAGRSLSHAGAVVTGSAVITTKQQHGSSAELVPPAKRSGDRRRREASDDHRRLLPADAGRSASATSSAASSGTSSRSPSRERRRRRQEDEDFQGSKDSLHKGGGGGGGKRRHVPSKARHRAPSADAAWGGALEEADGATPGRGGGGGGGPVDDDGEAPYLSSRGSPHTSDYNSGSGHTVSDLSAGAPLPSSSHHGRDLSGGPPSAIDLLSDFDSKSTWAGASALSVATGRTGSVFETSSALSQFPGSARSTASTASVWSQQPTSTRHGEQLYINGALASKGRSSPPHARVAVGTPARRGSRKGNMDAFSGSMAPAAAASSSSSAAGGGGGRSGKQRSAQQRPATTSRRAVMSPHGQAMDAAIRLVEERGARLGIVREEADANANANERTRDPSYANQIAAPAMTSLEQRRQRAKAWAKSR